MGDIAVGVVGALIGASLFRMFGLSLPGGLLGSLIVATIGAVILLCRLRVLERR